MTAREASDDFHTVADTNTATGNSTYHHVVPLPPIGTTNSNSHHQLATNGSFQHRNPTNTSDLQRSAVLSPEHSQSYGQRPGYVASVNNSVGPTGGVAVGAGGVGFGRDLSRGTAGGAESSIADIPQIFTNPTSRAGDAEDSESDQQHYTGARALPAHPARNQQGGSVGPPTGGGASGGLSPHAAALAAERGVASAGIVNTPGGGTPHGNRKKGFSEANASSDHDDDDGIFDHDDVEVDLMHTPSRHSTEQAAAVHQNGGGEGGRSTTNNPLRTHQQQTGAATAVPAAPHPSNPAAIRARADSFDDDTTMASHNTATNNNYNPTSNVPTPTAQIGGHSPPPPAFATAATAPSVSNLTTATMSPTTPGLPGAVSSRQQTQTIVVGSSGGATVAAAGGPHEGALAAPAATITTPTDSNTNPAVVDEAELRRRVASEATDRALAQGATASEAIAIGVAAAAAAGGGAPLPASPRSDAAGITPPAPATPTPAGGTPTTALPHGDRSGKPRVPNSEIHARPHVVLSAATGGGGGVAVGNTHYNNSGGSSSPPDGRRGFPDTLKTRQAVLLDSPWLLASWCDPTECLQPHNLLTTRCLIADNCNRLHEEDEDCCGALVVGHPNLFLALLCSLDVLSAGCPCGCFYHGCGTAVFGCWSRWMVRRRYRVEGYGWSDCLMYMCCVSCATAQINYEIRNNQIYGLPPSSWASGEVFGGGLGGGSHNGGGRRGLNGPMDIEMR